MTTTTTTTEEAAKTRVENSEALKPYEDLLLNYDWSNQEEHLNWVATAPESEIIAWAEQIRRDEDNN